MLQVGSLVDGKYKILSKVGQGGMSVVWMAINEKANKTWAVKEVRKDGILDFEAVRQGLVAETDILKKLSHPNLPSIIDVIDTADSFIIIMDYIQGNSLDEALLEYGAQPQEYVIEWAKQLCDVLGYLHSRQPPIIYRDMKPANIMLKPDGNVMLIDFGTAREFKEKNLADTTCLGTVGYAAPEQFGGMGQTDARTDIYCLGATLYHLVTGCNPSEPPYEMKPIRQINPALSGGLERIILKCTQRNPADRYQSAAELMYALDHYDEIDEHYRKKQKRRLAVFLTAVALCLALGAAGLTFRGLAARKASDTYETLLQNAADTTDYAQRAAYYRACLEIPGKDGEAEPYLGLIRTYQEDETFSKEEEAALTKLLSNHRQALMHRPENYAKICYQAGKLYWFYYEGGESKFTSASYAKTWFDRMLTAADPNDPNRAAAEVYAAVGDFYASITELQTTGDDKGAYEKLFSDLSKLLETVGKNESETDLVRLEMLELARSAIQQYATKFKWDGVRREDMETMLEEIRKLAGGINSDLPIRGKLLNLIPDTKQDIALAFETGEGGAAQ